MIRTTAVMISRPIGTAQAPITVMIISGMGTTTSTVLITATMITLTGIIWQTIITSRQPTKSN